MLDESPPTSPSPVPLSESDHDPPPSPLAAKSRKSTFKTRAGSRRLAIHAHTKQSRSKWDEKLWDDNQLPFEKLKSLAAAAGYKLVAEETIAIPGPCQHVPFRQREDANGNEPVTPVRVQPRKAAQVVLQEPTPAPQALVPVFCYHKSALLVPTADGSRWRDRFYARPRRRPIHRPLRPSAYTLAEPSPVVPGIVHGKEIKQRVTDARVRRALLARARQRNAKKGCSQPYSLSFLHRRLSVTSSTEDDEVESLVYGDDVEMLDAERVDAQLSDKRKHTKTPLKRSGSFTDSESTERAKQRSSTRMDELTPYVASLRSYRAELRAYRQAKAVIVAEHRRAQLYAAFERQRLRERENEEREERERIEAEAALELAAREEAGAEVERAQREAELEAQRTAQREIQRAAAQRAALEEEEQVAERRARRLAEAARAAYHAERQREADARRFDVVRAQRAERRAAAVARAVSVSPQRESTSSNAIATIDVVDDLDALAVVPVQPQSLAPAVLPAVQDSPASAIDTTTSALPLSPPPRYVFPFPETIPLRPASRPPPLQRAPSAVLPRYQPRYNQSDLPSSPPPPYHAQTDNATLIPPVFLLDPAERVREVRDEPAHRRTRSRPANVPGSFTAMIIESDSEVEVQIEQSEDVRAHTNTQLDEDQGWIAWLRSRVSRSIF